VTRLQGGGGGFFDELESNSQRHEKFMIAAFCFENHFISNATELAFEDLFHREKLGVGLNYSQIRLRSHLAEQGDSAHFGALKNANKLADCLRETHLSILDSKFAHTLAVHVDYGAKCVYNTEFVHAIAHSHAIHWSRPGFRVIKVARTDGFASHFPDKDIAYEGDHAGKYYVGSVQDWQLDLEYAYFFVKTIARSKN
jgi:hypothetical protein